MTAKQMRPYTREQDLAIRVVNLREGLKVANRLLAEVSMLQVHVDELESPSFRRGRSFWAQVRRLCRREIR